MKEQNLPNVILSEVAPGAWEKLADASMNIIEQLLSPITSLTTGLGKYISQKISNSIEIQRAMYQYSLQVALEKARKKALTRGIILHSPIHEKSFLSSLDEASIEFNKELHDKWTNLLSEQLTSDFFHPNYVNILKSLSPKDARILEQLKSYATLENGTNSWMISLEARFQYWIYDNDDDELKKWGYSNLLLHEYKLADVTGPGKSKIDVPLTTIFYRTPFGDEFLKAVSDE
jgi:hypothetical protein